jgi:hypothetical protein
MTILLPINLARFQTALVTVFDDATGAESGWAYGEGVYNSTFAGDFVNLTLTGPMPQATTAARGNAIQPCASVDFTVDSAVEGQLIGVYVNDIPIRHEVTGVDTVETIRDTLVAAVAAIAPDEFTATAGGAAGAWTLEPAYFGGIWSARYFGSMSADVTLEDELAMVTIGTARFSVQVEAFSKGREPSTGAWALASKLMAALQLPEYTQTFADYGVGIGTIGQGVDLTAIAGGSWETRVAFDFAVNLRTVVVRPVDQISTVSLAAAMSTPTLTSTIEAASP